MSRRKVKCYQCGFLALTGAEDTIELKSSSALSQLQALKLLNLLGLLELKQTAREKLARNDLNPLALTCARNVWSNSELIRQHRNHALHFVNKERKCRFFLQYVPGYSPMEHFELQREREQRRFLIVVSLLSAAIGAAIATAANYIFSLFR